MSKLIAFPVAAVSALVGVVLGAGALFSFVTLVGSMLRNDTWGAVGSLMVLTIVLAKSADRCIRYAGHVLEEPIQNPPPVR